MCKVGNHQNNPHRSVVSFPLLDLLKSEGYLSLKNTLTQRGMSMCAEALSCALTQPAPMTPWDRGITTPCALASAPKRVFSGCWGANPKGMGLHSSLASSSSLCPTRPFPKTLEHCLLLSPPPHHCQLLHHHPCQPCHTCCGCLEAPCAQWCLAARCLQSRWA